MRTKRVVAYRTQRTNNIAHTVTDDFLKDIAGVNIDLSGCPSVTSIPDSNFLDERFSTLTTDGGNGALQFKRWMRESQKAKDGEVSTILDRAVRDGTLPRQADDADGDSKRYYVNGEAVEVMKHGDQWHARHNGKLYIGTSRDGCAMAVARDTAQREFEPDENQKLAIARNVAAVHDATSVEDANRLFTLSVRQYLAAATGLEDIDVLSSPRYRPTVDKAIMFCWLAVRTDFSPGSDWPNFADAFAAGRPFTVSLLDGARRAYDQAAQAGQRLGITEPAAHAAPTAEEIDDLSDEAISQLYRGVSRTVARQYRPKFTPNQTE